MWDCLSPFLAPLARGRVGVGVPLESPLSYRQAGKGDTRGKEYRRSRAPVSEAEAKRLPPRGQAVKAPPAWECTLCNRVHDRQSCPPDLKDFADGGALPLERSERQHRPKGEALYYRKEATANKVQGKPKSFKSGGWREGEPFPYCGLSDAYLERVYKRSGERQKDRRRKAPKPWG